MSVRRADQGAALAAARALPASISAAQRSRYRTLRVMCRTSGLAATYAFIAAKAGTATLGSAAEDVETDIGGGGGEVAQSYRATLDQVTAHLRSVGLADNVEHPVDVVAWLGALRVDEYTRASNAVSDLLTWLSRLAEASPDRRPGTAAPGV